MSFLQPWAAAAFALPLFFLLMLIIASIRQNRYLLYMTGRNRRIGPNGGQLLLLLSLILLVPALMRPVSNPRLISREQKGRNLVFLVDVSRSMLAGDLIPNRLERARYDILNSLDVLQGNRVALVAFAGKPVLKCPLTKDYAYFRAVLEDLDVNSVSRGGTNLGDAVRVVLDDLFDPSDLSAMDIILITDGEDQDSFPLESAGRAGREGIRLITIGLGDDKAGSVLPSEEGKELMTYDNETVLSRADLETLRAMSRASAGGWTVAVSEGRIPLERIIGRINRSGEQKSTGKEKRYEYDEHYRWFLIPSLLLFCAALLSETGFFVRRRH